MFGHKKNNKGDKEKSAGPDSQKREGVKAIKSSASSGAKGRSGAVGQRPRTTIHVVSNIKDLPSYKEVLTDVGGDFELTEKHRDFLALMLLNNERRQDVLLLATKEYFNSIHANGLKSRAQGRGYRVTKKAVEQQVLRMVYQESREGVNLEKTEEHISNYEKEFAELLLKATKEEASDIHIEVRREDAKVRFRINGSLKDITNWKVKYAQEMGQVIYSVVAEEKDVTFTPDRPQDAVIDREVGGTRVRVRLATMPAYPDGFDMVMRLLPMGVGGKAVPLAKLGYIDAQVQSIQIAVAKPVGVTVVAGTTGSGKSTSLKNMLLSKISSYKGMIKVITVEDPPEYFIEGATQVPVVRSKNSKNDKNQNPFASSIRAAMRSDPDVLMIGEVRDEDSADLLVHAVQSGHQVFTTVHASSAIGIVPRLVGMGVGRDVLGGSDFLSGLVYQTLLPVLCSGCARSFSDINESSIDSELLSRLSIVCDLSEDNIKFRGDGCDRCGGTGVVGRTVAAEVIVPDHHIMKYFREGNDTDAWAHWRDHGGKTALSIGIEKMKGGLVDPRDVEHRLGLLTLEGIMDDGVFNMEEEMALIGATKSAMGGADRGADDGMDDGDMLSSMKRLVDEHVDFDDALDDVGTGEYDHNDDDGLEKGSEGEFDFDALEDEEEEVIFIDPEPEDSREEADEKSTENHAQEDNKGQE